MADFELSAELVGETRTAWNRYLDLTVPFRPQLHRYCRRLTGDVWDAEDLVQDTLLKGFATLAASPGAIANSRGYLTRIATNLWIDTQRRRTAEALALADAAQTQAGPPAAGSLRDDARDAGARLLEQLAPRSARRWC
jgi:RNA polymerase sigma-70 factor (ECF subfamily)